MSTGLIILIVFVLLVLTVMFKFKEVRHKVGLVIASLLFLFVVASAIHLYKNNSNMDLTTFDGVLSAGKIYFSWLTGLAGNVVKITGYAVRQNWSLDSNVNKTALTNSTLVKK